MNKKGVFFTFIVFLLVAAIIVSSSATKQTFSKQTETTIDETAFSSVNARFQNIYNEVFALKTGYPGRVQGRILPFYYKSGNDGENGWFEIEQNVPLEDTSTEITETFDALNLYSIFISEKSNNIDVTTVSNAAKNSAWGGTDELIYSVLPQCVKYDPQPDTETLTPPYPIVFQDKTSAECTAASFDPNDIKRIDLDIVITDELRIKKLQGNGNLSEEPENAFDPASLLPYLSIHVSVPNCLSKSGGELVPPAECEIDGEEQTISNHVSLTEDNGFEIQLQTGSPIQFYVLNSTQLALDPKVIFSTDYTPSVGGYKLQTTTKITFKDSIDEVRFRGFDFTVSKTNFPGLERGAG